MFSANPRTDALDMVLKPGSEGASFVDIPGELGFWKTYDIAAERVALPLKARAGLGLVGWMLLFQLLLLVPACFLILPAAIETALRGTVNLQVVISALLIVPFAICVTAASLTLVKDRFSSSSGLVLDVDGLTDHRLLDRTIRWSEIAHARVRYSNSDFAAVTLRLRHPIAARHNPFRLGTLGFAWRRRPNELHIALLSLTIPARRLALTIATLVKVHGGGVDAVHPTEGNPLRHH